MKSSPTSFFFFFLLLFFLGFYFFSNSIGFSGHLASSLSSSSSVLHEESRSQRDANSPFLHRKLIKYHKSKIVVEGAKESNVITSSLKPEFSLSSKRVGIDNLDDSVYHTDYHGVSTHPTPTPKHPKP